MSQHSDMSPVLTGMAARRERRLPIGRRLDGIPGGDHRRRTSGFDGDLDRLTLLDDVEGVEHVIEADVLGDEVLDRDLSG